MPAAGDRVWDAALRALAASDDGTIRAGDVRDRLAEPVEPRTVTRHLRAMAELGWLDRDSPQAHTWRAGPRAEEYLSR